MAEIVTACPYCRAAASGRFCSECGKALELGNSEGGVARDLLGIRVQNFSSLAHTTWLAISEPHVLTRRWCAGDRHKLSSPVALLSVASALAALLAVMATALSGNHLAAIDDIATGNILDSAPFLKPWFADAAREAAADPAAFSGRLRQVGSWLAAAWPVLFLLPGALVLAPWRRISRHDALIVACVETVTIMTLAGVYAALRIAVPGIASSPLVTTGIWLLLCIHSTLHIRRVIPDASIPYAISRPVLATLVFPVVVYAWMVGVMLLTLALAPLLST